MPYAMYLRINGRDHDLPGSFGQALSSYASANWYYGRAVGRNVPCDAERELTDRTYSTLLDEIENLITLYSQGKLHRPGVPDHDVGRTSGPTNLAPALSDWEGE